MKNLYYNSIGKKLKHTILLLVILFGFSNAIDAQVRKAFTQRTAAVTPTKTVYNVKGDFTMLGNTCLTPQNYSNTVVNNDSQMIYVDTDGDSSTFNSSSSTLVIPVENGSTPACSNIVFAGLYWTGKSSANQTFNVTKNSVTKTFNKREVKLKGPTGAYQTITAAATNIYYPSGSDDDIYAAYAEVTDFVKARGIGQYTVADLALLEGNPGGTGYSGGWGMIVIYENSKMKWRDITIFDGYAYVDAGNSAAGIELPVSGFNTVQTGNVGVKIGFMASEGDVGYTRDYFQIRNLNTTNYTTLSRNVNGVVPNPDNFFDSSITAPGVRNPNLQNNTGIDIGIVNIPNTNNSIIGNSQTSTRFRYGTNGDTYSIFNIVMSVDAYVPQAEALITATTINGAPAVLPYTILPGQEAGYSVDIKNLGTEAINNYKVIVPIPYNTTYVAGSASGTIFSPQTTPTPNSITFNPTLGATGSIVWDFGTLVLPANPSSLLARLTFRLRSTTDCAILSNATCSSNMSVVGNSTGIGAITNVALNNSRFIQGYNQNGACAGEPIPAPINIAINGASYVSQNCPSNSTTRNFSYCSASTSIGTSLIASNFPPGSQFYNSFPVTTSSIEYTDANPIPLVSGSTVTYYAVPSGGGSGCNFPFTITKCPVIVAQNDALAGGNGTTGNPNIGNVLSNNGSGSDTLNGVQALISQVNITVTTPATPINGNPVPVIDPLTGIVSVPAGTPAGTYTIVYNLCEKLNPTTNCDPATVIITVTSPAIVAQNDTISGGNGTTGNPNAGNVLNNNGNGPDTLNGNPAAIAQVNITVTTPATSIGGAPVPTLATATGQISVPAGTPAGTYTIVYNLCEKLNPTNCDPATVTITVTAPAIIANDDTISGGNGTTGNPNAGNVLNNNGNGPDTLNGNPAAIAQVNITVTTPATSIGGAPVPTLATATGQISVPAGTPAGTYTIVYNLCEKLNPTNCDPATVTITVTAPAIVAQNDTISGGNGTTGNPNAGNVLNNNGNGPDTLNGNPAAIAQVNITVTTPATSIGGAPVPTLATATGQISVPAGTPAGTYTIVYNLCEKLNPTNCDPATVTITVTAPAIVAQNDTISGGNGTTGNPNAGNVLNNNGNGPDTLNGNPAAIAQVNITVTTPATSIGGAPVPTLATATGQISVPAGTPAGTYTIVYNLCEKLNPTNCDPATVTITVTAPAIIANDDSGAPINGLTGGTAFTNVLVNDTLNGVPVLASQVNTTFVSSTNPGITLSGTNVLVAPGTPAGSYTLVYQICEILNPTNCDTATVSVSVSAAAIVANDDTGAAVNGLTGGTAFTNVLVNDTLNGVPVLASQVNTTFVSSTNPGITLSGTNVLVAPGTPAGSYTLVYQICEILNPTNCDTATVSVSVSAAAIVANDDTGAAVNGLTGGTAFTNVLVNDTLNGVPVLASQVNTTFVSSTNPGITLSGTNVLVAPGTPAGSYTLVYQICEILNPTNCDTATVSVSVSAAAIVANDDTGAAVNGLTGGTAFTNVLVNDTLNGVPVLASQVNTTFVSSTNPGITLSGTNVLVAPGTPAGSYTLVYQICEILNPTNCDTATVSVSVTAAQIIANDDSGAPINGLTGGTAFTNVLVNDTLNGVPVLASQVNTTFVSSTNPGITLSGTDVLVAPGTPAGSYTLVYQICEILNPTNCDTATVSVSVTAAQIIANDDSGAPVNGLTGGTAFTNVLVNDTLNGVPVLASQVNTTFVSSTNPGITLSGTDVLVAPGTPAGSYSLVYQICEILNPTNCDTATVTVSVTAAAIIANDDSGAPVNGLTGGTAFTNVLVNDTLNGVPVLASQVNTTFVSSTNPGITLSGTDVLVAPGTPAGSYTLVYQICEILNPTNCDTATVSVSVTAAQIIANDDSGAPVNGLTGGTAFTNVLVNDTLNGVPVLASQVNISQVSTTNPGVTLVGTDVVVAPGTPAGSYTLVYQICEILNPTNCDTATVTVSVTAAAIVANDDNYLTVQCSNLGLIGNILDNDSLNSTIGLSTNQVNLTILSGSYNNLNIDTSGNVNLISSGSCGSYTFTYRICEILNPNNCDEATVTVVIQDLIAPITPQAPATLNVACASEVPAMISLTANDNCSGAITAQGVDTIAAGNCPNSFTVTRTWTFTDACNNTSSVSQTINVNDNIAPEAPEAPATVNVACASEVPAMISLTANDNCSGAITAQGVDTIAAGNCPNSFTVTRTWTFTDACNNTSSVSQTINVNDTIAPVAPEAPATLNVACASEVPAMISLTANDNCSGEITAQGVDTIAAGNCPNSFTVTRTWTFTDACNNTSSVSQTINVNDTIAPVAPEAPATVNVACASEVPAMISLTANDNCSGEITAQGVDTIAAGNCPNSFTVTRTWTFTDACNNTSSVSQTINVNDNIAPVAPEAPATLNVACASEVPAMISLTANDNCSGAITAQGVDTIAAGNCPNSFTVTRTWTFTDACNNTSSVSQTINVNDNIAPVAPEAPATLNVACASEVPAMISLTANDNCSGAITAQGIDTIAAGNCPNSFTVTRTWTFTDACNNTSSVSQTINVNDTIAPVTPEAPATLNVACASEVPAMISLTANDNCSGEITAQGVDTIAAGNCPNSFTVTRTWTFTDACNNTSSVSQTINVNDNIAPVAPEAPATINVACASEVPAMISLTANDNCSGEITAQGVDTIAAGNCPNSFTVTRTWTFTDACNNTSSVSQTINVNDNIAPVAPEAPATINVACASEVPAMISLTANDNCSGEITAQGVDTIAAGNCPNSFTVTRTWTFTDACNNTSSVSQTINVNDTIAPVAPEAPATLNVACASEVPAMISLTANDNCSGEITAQGVDTIAAGNCPNSFTVTRTWTFTDACNNTSSVSQTINVNDNIAPVAPEAPATVNVACASEVPAMISLTANDNCSGAITAQGVDSIAAGNCPNSFTVTRTWTFTDACNNTSSVSQTINVNDNIAPVTPEAPATVNVACASEVPAMISLTANDNCSGAITAQGVDTIAQGNCPNSFTVTRTWTFTDACNNTSSVSQTINVNDNIAPVAPEAPATVNVACASEVPAMILLTANDNCSGEITAQGVDTIAAGNCPNSFIVTRTWTFTDACNNTSSVSQTINVNDTIAPVAPEAPATVNVACASEVPAMISLTANDNCSGAITSQGVDSIAAGNCPNSFTVTRTWTFTDACNNTSSVSQTINVNDNIAPVAPEAPATVNVACASEVPAMILLTANDNCSGAITAQGVDTIAQGNCPNSFTVTRTWTFTDACNNTSSVSQTINVNDNIAPVAPEAPATVNVACASEVPAMISLTANDNCNGAITVLGIDSIAAGNCPNSFTVTRTWTFTDACNNTSSVSQTINVNDNIAPVAPEAPATVNVACASEVPAMISLTANDNCSGAITAQGVDSIAAGNCPNSFTVTRTWTFTDACNNTSSVSQTINVNDNTAPVAPEAPASMTATCSGEVPAMISLTANDNCNGAITVLGVDSIAAGNCPNSFTVTRTWTFTDACSNTSSVSQTISVGDTLAPTTPQAPATVNVACASEVPAMISLTANDNCSGEITAQGVDSIAAGNCPNSFTVTRTWTFTDACNNTSSVSQTINVNDNIAPVAPEAPATVNVACASEVPAMISLTANDNCSGAITAQGVDSIAAGNCPNSFIVTRTWTFTDACNNTSSVSQTINVNDNIAPVTPEAPATVNVACASEVPAMISLTANDNCSGAITAQGVDTIAQGNCPNSFTVTRTWTFTDACNNTSSVSQTINVNDTIAPVAPEAPATVNVACASEVPAMISLTANDNCSGAITAQGVDSIAAGNCPNSFTVTRTWTFTDACNNTSSVSQTINVNDTIAPVAPEAPATVNVACASEVPAMISLTANDNCSGEITAQGVDSIAAGNCPNSFTVTRTWTFTDACNNTSSVSQTINVNDTIAPVAPEAPATVNVACASEVPAMISLTANDNCSGTITAQGVDSIAAGNCPNSFTVTRTWTFTDACNNTSSVSQTININDNIAPVAPEAPATVNVACASEVPSMISLTANDNCSGAITAQGVDSIAAGNCPNSFTVTRTWTFTDACNNTSSVSQTINVNDTIAPVAPEAPASMTATCSGEVPAMISLTANDNCNGAITVLGVDSIAQGNCPNSFTVTRTWTFTDACNNTSSVSQTISVNDTVAPTFNQSAPANTSASCDNIPAPAVLTAVDNCGTATVNMTETILAGNCPSNYQIVRTWTATDACGNNSAPVSQTITVTDTVGPQIINPIPTKISVTCDTIPVAPVLGPTDFTDNCSTVGTPVFTQTQTQPDANGTYQIVRTWTVSDACGNTTTVTQSIAVTRVTSETTVNVTAEICNDEVDAAYDLSTFLPQGTPTGGTWVNESNVGIFNGSVLNSYQVAEGSYTFSYTYDTATCPQKVNVIVPIIKCGIVLPCDLIIIHNAFTPNGDGTNEYFSIENIEDIACYPTNSVEIYNRWGVLVYETKQYDNNTRKFVGVSEGRATISKSDELPTGTYFYIIQWTTTDGQTVNKDGYLYLTR